MSLLSRLEGTTHGDAVADVPGSGAGEHEADAETKVRVVVTYEYEDFTPTKLLRAPPELDW